MSEIYLVTYATEEFKLRQMLLNYTAKKYADIKNTISWDSDKIRHTEFYLEHKKILDQPRGNGYWLWKPYIILSALEAASCNVAMSRAFGRVSNGRKIRRSAVSEIAGMAANPAAPLSRSRRSRNVSA